MIILPLSKNRHNSQLALNYFHFPKNHETPLRMNNQPSIQNNFHKTGIIFICAVDFTIFLKQKLYGMSEENSINRLNIVY